MIFQQTDVCVCWKIMKELEIPRPDQGHFFSKKHQVRSRCGDLRISTPFCELSSFSNVSAHLETSLWRYKIFELFFGKSLPKLFHRGHSMINNFIEATLWAGRRRRLLGSIFAKDRDILFIIIYVQTETYYLCISIDLCEIYRFSTF